MRPYKRGKIIFNIARGRGIENFEFIVSELVQINSDNSRVMIASTF